MGDAIFHELVFDGVLAGHREELIDTGLLLAQCHVVRKLAQCHGDRHPFMTQKMSGGYSGGHCLVSERGHVVCQARDSREMDKTVQPLHNNINNKCIARAEQE